MAKSLFPPSPLEEARSLADTIARSGSGQPMRRIDIFHELGRSAESGPGRNLVTASSGFGLTLGGYQADQLSLTDLGRRLSIDADRTATIDAVLQVDVFRQFFETYANSQLPSEVAARSFLASHGVPTERVQACFDLILENGRYSGLIAQRSGTEYVLTRDHAAESLAAGPPPPPPPAAPPRTPTPGGALEQGGAALQLPGLHINVEIHLPSDQTPEVYDAIFASLRKHLIDGRAIQSE